PSAPASGSGSYPAFGCAGTNRHDGKECTSPTAKVEPTTLAPRHARASVTESGEAVTGEGAGRVSSPAIGLFLGADALRTRGRYQRLHRDGTGEPHPAGSQTPGRHGNMGCGTREALHLAWSLAPRPARRTRGARPCGPGAGRRTAPAYRGRDRTRGRTHDAEESSPGRSGGGRGGKGA